MSNKSFLTEPEAATFSGVSVQTLSRFAEAGYLTVETSSEGERSYSRDDITSVFGISEGSLARKVEESHDAPEVVSSQSSVIQFPSKKEDADIIQKPAPVEQVESESFEEGLEEPVQGQDIQAEKNATGDTPVLDGELARMQNIIDIQEKILDMRDEQLKEVRKERDWLRERVERLEQKAERDQLLLLAETQTLRQLITHEKRSPVRATLEWLGFVEPQKEPVARSNSIDHGKK